MACYPRERDSLASRPFAGTRARLGTFTVPTPANDSTPPQATPAGEPSPGDCITNVSARPGDEVDGELAKLMANFPREGKVEWIGIRAERRAPVASVTQVEAIAGYGLAGDHYASKSDGKRQITLRPLLADGGSSRRWRLQRHARTRRDNLPHHREREDESGRLRERRGMTIASKSKFL